MEFDISTKGLLRRVLPKEELEKYPILMSSESTSDVNIKCDMLKEALANNEDTYPFQAYAHNITHHSLKTLLDLKKKGKDYTRYADYGKMQYYEIERYLLYIQQGVPNSAWLRHVGCKIGHKEQKEYMAFRKAIGPNLDKAIATYDYDNIYPRLYLHFSQKFQDNSEELLMRLAEFCYKNFVNNALWLSLSIENLKTTQELMKRLDDFQIYATGGSLEEVDIYLEYLIRTYRHLLTKHDMLTKTVEVRMNLVRRKVQKEYIKFYQVIEILLRNGITITDHIAGHLSTTLAPLLRVDNYLETIEQDKDFVMYFNLGLSDTELYDTIYNLTKVKREKTLKPTWYQILQERKESLGVD